MNMQIDYETERELGIDYETLAVKVADKVLEMEKCPYDAQVYLQITKRLRELILSFAISQDLRMFYPSL